MEVAGDAVAAVHRPTGVRMDLSRYGFTRRPDGGDAVAIGLRPEHFAVGDADGMDRAAVFDLPVRYSERTGGDATAFLAAADQLVAVRIDPAQAARRSRGPAGQGELPAGQAQRLRRPDRAAAVEPVAKPQTGEEDAHTNSLLGASHGAGARAACAAPST